MSVQVITRDGEAEYAVLPWAEYQALLREAGRLPSQDRDTTRAPFEHLAALRDARGMTPEQVARDVGISPAYLALIERGERQPDDAIRRALARVLGLAGWEPEA